MQLQVGPDGQVLLSLDDRVASRTRRFYGYAGATKACDSLDSPTAAGFQGGRGADIIPPPCVNFGSAFIYFS